ncbi:MAG: virulence factor BrkB family protein [Wenzhouxiangellaceae bacterium]|nr:virulence factor BrkB family protein [Wenzhouxiangellaceae bacterium]
MQTPFRQQPSAHSRATGLGTLTNPRWLRAFGHHLWKHFREDRCFEAAAALSYTSLLALVPLMAVMLGVLSAFPVFDYGVGQLQDFIFSNFVPAAGDVIREYLDQFIARSAGLTGTGTLFLVVTAVILMATIEKSLNRIWRVDRPRRPANRLTVYWAVLTLGPLLLGGSLGLTSYLAALPLLAPELVRGPLQSLILVATPFGVAMLAFTLIFVIVPNRHVRWHHALAGAAFSALAFEVSKRGFVLYVAHFPTYQKLYGALAAIPIFLVWIYVSWVVILLGASVSAALTTFNYRRADWRWNRRHHLLLALRLIGHLRHAQREGRGCSSEALLELESAATDAELQWLLDRLDRAGLLQRDERGSWFLCADLDEVTLADLYRSMPLVLPLCESDTLPSHDALDEHLIAAMQQIEQQAGPVLQRSLKSLVELELRPEKTGESS